MGFSLPALLGGAAVRPQGPPEWPLADDEVLQSLVAAYRDGSWGKYDGIYVNRLTRQLAQYQNVEHVLTCGSGTYAVELALRALEIGPGHEVLLAAYDYPGNFLGVHAVGARPVLVDIAADNWNLDPRQLTKAIGPVTRAIIVSHLHGGIVPIAEIMALAWEKNLAVIEDAAQQPGAEVEGRKVGSWGDVGIWSFGGSKLLSAGRGGALFTARADIYQRARRWHSRGNIINPLSELQAAALLPQLPKLDERNAQRRSAVKKLSERLAKISGIRPFVNRVTDCTPGYYKVGWQLNAVKFGLDRDRLIAAVRAEGIALDAGFRALHVGRSPKRFARVAELTEAEHAHDSCLVLHHPVLLGTDSDLDEVVDAFHKVHAHTEQLIRDAKPSA
jgi:dTDP-4-amino-4,6-dideoxygalactose transaminase